MTDAAAKILEVALSLPEDERRYLVKVLSRSLDASGTDLSPAWKGEIAQRIADIESGAVEPVSWDDAEARIKRVVGVSRGLAV